MKKFLKLYERAAARKGGEAALEALISTPKSEAALARIPDDRWLSAMAKSVFRAGFNWKVVENKWPDIEAAYSSFNPHLVAFQSDDDLDVLVEDPRVIRQWRKLKAIRANAQYVVDLAAEYGSAAEYFAAYPASEYIGLLEDMRKRGSYLGGTSAQYFLREMSLRHIQDAFNDWVDDGGQSLTRVSRVLAFTVG
jgi:3-methyladenine DNA glycosylase Tag